MNVNRYILALICALALMVSPSIAIALTSPGMTESAAVIEEKNALNDSVKTAEEALEALKSGAGGKEVGKLINNARQHVRRVETERLDLMRDQSVENMKKAQQALDKGNQAQAEELLSNGLRGFKEMQSSF